MKKHFKRIFAVILCGAMAAGFAGCSDEDENSVSEPIDDVAYMDESELPYGATTTQLSSKADETVRMDIEYDNRFLDEEEARKISDYMAALNTVDDELMKNTVQPEYLAYLAENNTGGDVKGYIQQIHDNIAASYTGEGFDLNYVMVNDCITPEDGDTSFANVDALLSSICGEDIAGKITSRKLMKIDCMYTMNGEGSYSLTNRTGFDQSIYVYVIDGEYYVL